MIIELFLNNFKHILISKNSKFQSFQVERIKHFPRKFSKYIKFRKFITSVLLT